ncbi:INO80 complex subunit 2 [Yarrowia lipolytica]|jgi:Ino eighty subunit 2|nr:INO80 complex subunit 2 [Yarrowia lipolytica]
MSSSELSEIDEGYDQELSDSDFDRPVRAKKLRVLEDEEEVEDEEDQVEDEDEPEEAEEEAEDEPESELDSEELEFLDYNDQGTPDPDRMTNRQKSMLRDEKGPSNEDFLQLPANSRQQKILSQEEQALKRTELARRRKNLSERKLEEEKMDTLNKLLYKQPKKTASGADTPQEEDKGVKKRREFISHPAMTSWKSNKDGLSLSWGVEAKVELED